MHVVVAVPARLESSRLPGKVMADIGGRPMLRRVLERFADCRRRMNIMPLGAAALAGTTYPNERVVYR